MNLCLFLFLILMLITIISTYEKPSKQSDVRTTGVLRPGSLQKRKKIRSRRLKKQKGNNTEMQPKQKTANKRTISSKRVDQKSPRLRKKHKKMTMIANDQPMINSPPKTQSRHRKVAKKLKRQRRGKTAAQSQPEQEAKKMKEQSKIQRKKIKNYRPPANSGTEKKLKAANERKMYAPTLEEAMRQNIEFIGDQTNKSLPEQLRQTKNGKRVPRWKKNKKPAGTIDLPKNSKVENEILTIPGAKYEKQKRNDKSEVKERVVPAKSLTNTQQQNKEKINQPVNITDNFFGSIQNSNHPILKQPGIRIVKPWENGKKHVDDDGTVYVIDEQGFVYGGKNFGHVSANIDVYRTSKKNVQEAQARRQKELKMQVSTEDPNEIQKESLDSCAPIKNGKCLQKSTMPTECIEKYKNGACFKGKVWFYIIDMKTGEVEGMHSEMATFPAPYFA